MRLTLASARQAQWLWWQRSTLPRAGASLHPCSTGRAASSLAAGQVRRERALTVHCSSAVPWHWGSNSATFTLVRDAFRYRNAADWLHVDCIAVDGLKQTQCRATAGRMRPAIEVDDLGLGVCERLTSSVSNDGKIKAPPSCGVQVVGFAEFYPTPLICRRRRSLQEVSRNQ